MICPKCQSEAITSIDKIRKQSLDFIAVKIMLGVHPFSDVYGILPEKEFSGLVWKCEDCEFEFYTEQFVEEIEQEKRKLASVSM